MNSSGLAYSRFLVLLDPVFQKCMAKMQKRTRNMDQVMSRKRIQIAEWN